MRDIITTEKLIKTEVKTKEVLVCDLCLKEDVIYDNRGGLILSSGSQFIELKVNARQLVFGKQHEPLNFEKHYCRSCFAKIIVDLQSMFGLD